MNNKRKSNNDIFILLITLIGFLIIFNLYISEIISSTPTLKNILDLLVETSEVEIKEINLLLHIIISIFGILTITFYFILNKIFLTILKVKKLSSSKLLLTVLISSILGPVISIFFIKYVWFSKYYYILSFLNAFLQPCLMFYLLKDEFKTKKTFLQYIVLLLLLAVINSLFIIFQFSSSL